MSAIFRCHNSLTDQTQSLLNYTCTFKLLYNVPYLGTWSSSITFDMNSHDFIQNARLWVFCRFIWIAMIFLNYNDVFKQVDQRKLRQTRPPFDAFQRGRRFRGQIKDAKALMRTWNRKMRNTPLPHSSHPLIPDLFTGSVNKSILRTISSTNALHILEAEIAREHLPLVISEMLCRKTTWREWCRASHSSSSASPTCWFDSMMQMSGGCNGGGGMKPAGKSTR